MIHTLFWLTGIVTWLMIALACALWLGTEIHERSVIRRRDRCPSASAPTY
jgi:hypothetical protein